MLGIILFSDWFGTVWVCALPFWGIPKWGEGEVGEGAEEGEGGMGEREAKEPESINNELQEL